MYPGEESRAFSFAFLGFLWAFGTYAGMLIFDSFLVLHFSAKMLPVSYCFCALLMLMSSGILVRVMRFASVYQIFVGQAALTALCYGVSAWNLQQEGVGDSLWFWVGMNALSNALHLLLTTHYWSFMDSYFDLQDGKRLFTLCSSAIFAGATLAGVLLGSGWLSTSEFLFLVVICMVATVFWARWISRNFSPVYDDTDSEGDCEVDLSFSQLFSTLLRSPFSLCLMGTFFGIQVLCSIADYSMLEAFQVHFVEGHAKVGGELSSSLARFMGTLSAWTSVANLIFGLFCYSRIVRWIGVHNSLLLVPVFYLVIFFGWPLHTGLLFPILAFFLQEGLLYTLSDNTYNLALNGVPSRIRYRTRIFNDSFMEPVGLLLGAGLLLLPGVEHPLFWGFLGAVGVFLCALGARMLYASSLHRNLMDHAVLFRKPLSDWLSGVSEEEKRERLELYRTWECEGTEQERVFFREFLEGGKGSGEVKEELSDPEELLNCLKNSREKEEKRIAAARRLKAFDDPAVLYNELRQVHLFYAHSVLLAQGGEEKGELLGEFFRDLVRLRLKLIVHLIGLQKGLEDVEVLIEGLESRNEKVRSCAVETLERVCDRKVWKKLFPLLDEDLPEQQCLDLVLRMTPLLSLREVLMDLNGHGCPRVSRIAAYFLQEEFVLSSEPSISTPLWSSYEVAPSY